MDTSSPREGLSLRRSGSWPTDGGVSLGKVNNSLTHTRHVFGWGRRECPGVLLAESTIFICVTMVLAMLDVSGFVENGVECVPKYDVEAEVVW